MPSITLSSDEFAELPPYVQRVVLGRFAQIGAEIGALDNDDDGPADLSVAQVKKLVSACSEKTIDVLREIIEFPVAGFGLSELEERCDAESTGLKGCWTGLTRVTRRILEDPEAMLIDWSAFGDDSDRGRVSAATHASLRTEPVT